MCEPFMLDRTGRSVADHQAATVDNYCRLRQLAPTLPFIPVLQGWRLGDYLACVDRYAAAGAGLPCPAARGIVTAPTAPATPWPGAPRSSPAWTARASFAWGWSRERCCADPARP